MPVFAELETKNRYAVCVGINRYRAPDQFMPLHCAEQDAQDVHALLLDHGFAREQCCLLLGAEATLEAIQQALTTFLLTKPRRDDLVVFYFAGHGVPISINDEEEEEGDEPQSDVFLCPYDFDMQQVVDERGIWLCYPLRLQKLRTDFFEQTTSKKVLFIFDSCHSGDFFGKKYRPRSSDMLATRYIEQPFSKHGIGRVALSSCLPHQTAREDGQRGHGIFTYHLLEALKGEARQAVRRDGWVTIGSLFEYLADTLPRNQRPIRNGVEHDTFKLLYYPAHADPNDTLQPLTLLKSHDSYALPHLSREDFDRILQQRQVTLESKLADRFYRAIQQSALYLDLVAQELAKPGVASPEAIVGRVAENPDNIFSYSIEGWKQRPVEWREVLKPILGLLLAAREPLSAPHLRQILQLDHDRLSDGLHRLGGLVSNDGSGRYALFHLKFYDYLRQDTSKSGKDYIFAQDEEENWHKTLADWCEQGDIQQVWQDAARHPVEQGRRLYARKHYITHLYLAQDWERVCVVLDDQQYGKMKVRYDPSTRAYSHDLRNEM